MVLESVVGKAVKKFYEDKYKDLSEDAQKRKVEAHLKALLPSEFITDISGSAGMSQQGYGMDNVSGAFGPPMKSVKDMVNNSGYNLVYESFTEGLEPIYFWILDWMRDHYWGIGYDVAKTMDRFEAAAGSGFFGDMGSRASIMQDRAMKLIGTINTVVRSVINILYDLKEFDQRLQLYKDLQSGTEDTKKNARLALKQFWMDRVDIQRGRGSINMLAQQLQFVTLRDAFMFAEDVEHVTKMDLNDRVKRLLGPRIADYLTWEKLSGKELQRRYSIERNYLKSQVESLRLYAQWAKPYLQASSRLQGELTGSPDLVTTFNTMQVQTTLLGTKQSGKYHSAVEVAFDYRTVPHTARQAQGVHYVQGGKVNIQFRGFAISEEEKEAIEKYELTEGLELAGVNEDMIKEIEGAVDDYFEHDEEGFEDPRERLGFLQRLVEKMGVKEEDKKFKKHLAEEIDKLKKDLKESKKEKSPGPFKALFDSFKDAPDFVKSMNPKGDKDETDKGGRGGVAKGAANAAYAVYLVYKKAHGMFTE